MPKKNNDIHNKTFLEQFGMKPYKLKAKEKYMTKRQLNHFKKLLNAWKQQLSCCRYGEHHPADPSG